MNDASFEMRLATLERTARRYRLAFFAVCVLAVGMGAVANEALKDAEFGTVKAKSFQVVTDGGDKVAILGYAKGEDGSEAGGLTVVSGQDKKAPFKATFVHPGRELKIFEADK